MFTQNSELVMLCCSSGHDKSPGSLLPFTKQCLIGHQCFSKYRAALHACVCVSLCVCFGLNWYQESSLSVQVATIEGEKVDPFCFEKRDKWNLPHKDMQIIYSFILQIHNQDSS